MVLYVAGYYLVQSEEEYSHICKAKPPAIQTDKNNGKNLTIKLKDDKIIDYFHVMTH